MGSIDFSVQAPLFLLLLPLLFFVPKLYGTTHPSPSGVARFFLPALRMVTFFLLILLLADPSIQWQQEEDASSEVLLLLDDSASLPFLDGDMHLDEWLPDLGEASSSLRVFTFGDSLIDHGLWDEEGATALREHSFGLKQASSYSYPLTTLQRRYGDAAIDAVVLVGDGRPNRGPRPLQIARNFPWPLHTAVTGREKAPFDAAITTLSTKRDPFPGREQPVEVTWQWSGDHAAKGWLSVYEGSQLLERRVIQGRGNQILRFHYTPLGSEARELKAVLTLDSTIVETNLLNNTRSLSVEPRAEPRSILLLAGSASPDLAFWQRVIASDPTWKADLHLDGRASSFTASLMENLDRAEVLLLVGWPTSRTDPDLVEKLIRASRSKAVLVHEQEGTQIGVLSDLLPGTLSGRPASSHTSSIQPAGADPLFRPETRLETLRSLWAELKPLSVHHLDVSALGSADVLFEVGDSPVALINRHSKPRVAWFAFSGFDVWERVSQVAWGENLRMEQMARYLFEDLLSGGATSSFELRVSKEDVHVGDYLDVNALLRREPLHEASVELLTTTEDGQEQHRLMRSPSRGEYTAQVRAHQAGWLKWKAILNQGDLQQLADSGRVLVLPGSREMRDMTRGSALMRDLAHSGGGKTFDLDQASDRQALAQADFLKSLPPRPQKIVEHRFDARGQAWILAVLILLIVGEWLWRRLQGML